MSREYHQSEPTIQFFTVLRFFNGKKFDKNTTFEIEVKFFQVRIYFLLISTYKSPIGAQEAARPVVQISSNSEGWMLVSKCG